MEVEVEAEAGPGPVLARADPELADSLVRENVPAPGEAEQTWPTEEEMAAADAEAPRARKRRVPEGVPVRVHRRRATVRFMFHTPDDVRWFRPVELSTKYGRRGRITEPLGTHGTMKCLFDSPLQQRDTVCMPLYKRAFPVWPENLTFAERAAHLCRKVGVVVAQDGEEDLAQQAVVVPQSATDAGDAAMLLEEQEADEGDDEEGGGAYAAALEAARLSRAERRRRAAVGSGEEADQLDFPDEVDVPLGQHARVRFQKYRGLKSMRTSAWDPKESLPADYARVFAFENFKRAHKRAKEAQQRATDDLDPCGVSAGTYVAVRIVGVPADAAERVLAHVAAGAAGAAVPLTVFGLMQHEAKLSVVNFAIRKATGYAAPIASKEALLFVTGLRSFTARPVLSTDDPGSDKHRMEKFLHT
ncbi:Pre-rRNA-processing protein TSR1, partial [Tetrabaena socialis]